VGIFGKYGENAGAGMADSEFLAEAIAAGFTRAQAEWLEANVAEEGHTHAIEDVEGLPEALDGDEGEEDDEEAG
jgi:hypothetical protein